MLKKYLFLLFLFLASGNLFSQQVLERSKPVLAGSARAISTEALSKKDLLPPSGEFKIYNPKNRSSNIVVPGKGYPKNLDAAWQKEVGQIPNKKPILVFDAATSGSTPTDPTGAVGPNHYVNAWNSAFAIYDKEGNLLSPPADLQTIGGTFVGEDLGDPIVFYDGFADRFVITQFSDSPNSLLVAITKGPDPVNDGWYTYRFDTGTFPDYPKFYVWGDGYYVTTNQDPDEIRAPGDPTDNLNEVVYVLERDKILLGEEAQHLGFPLPGIRVNGFYSPAGFFAVGKEQPPKGNAPIMYYQDDSWLGVNEDHLKIWLINVDWKDPLNSTIEESQNLGPSDGVTPFHSVFDGGSFHNLSQPGNAPDVDALQGAIMYPAAYRQFPDHNSVVFNFVVDIDPSVVEHAGIRWYELRQDASGGPWSVYQEGTYAPDGSDRWCGSIAMDKNGNIGMGFTVLNDSPENPIFPSLRYTGRYADDPLGMMTLQEETIAKGVSANPSNRYGDYSHITVDPTDEETFWFIGEYFAQGSRLNKVGVFRIAPEYVNDVGVVSLVSPKNGTLGSQEQITVTIRNFGSAPQSNFPVTYSVDEGTSVTETFNGTIQPTEQAEFTFSARADLSEVGTNYSFSAGTQLSTDENPENDFLELVIRNLPPNDVGITDIISPETGENLGMEQVVVIVENFGGEPQNNIPVAYRLDEGNLIEETINQQLAVGGQLSHTFQTPVDLSDPGKYEIFATTMLVEDSNEKNDSVVETVANLNCIPRGSDCSFGDGIYNFYLNEIVNENIYCTDGYYDFTGLSTPLDRSQRTFKVGVSSRFSDNRFSLWIDFNDNGFFDPSELLISSQVLELSNVVYTFEFTIPADAPLGEHLMRVRAGDTSYSGSLNDPCSVMEFGNTMDYTVVIKSDIEASALEDGKLLITSADQNIFDIRLTTSYQQFLWVTVHDMLGQKLVENRIDKSYNGYEYMLDMSYAAPGVYLVRVGTRKEGKVKRIIVR
ncbi:GEVED domain-containing protein [Salinimicrobium gaetbulicola]|uniref:GEVED domain-containing protein n=1 Tax=Salinimicrobium gaetbulicola TaxID=999702 RepID=A0ABW3IHW3_9FLAO